MTVFLCSSSVHCYMEITSLLTPQTPQPPALNCFLTQSLRSIDSHGTLQCAPSHELNISGYSVQREFSVTLFYIWVCGQWLSQTFKCLYMCISCIKTESLVSTDRYNIIVHIPLLKAQSIWCVIIRNSQWYGLFFGINCGKNYS